MNIARLTALSSLLLGMATASAMDRSGNAVQPVARSVKAPPTTALTVQECNAVGGTVYYENFALCQSGLLCRRHDQNNQLHQVCISKKE